MGRFPFLNFVTALWPWDLVKISPGQLRSHISLFHLCLKTIKRILIETHLIPVDIWEDSLEISVQCGCVSKDNFPSPAHKWRHLLCDSISLFEERYCTNYFHN